MPPIKVLRLAGIAALTLVSGAVRAQAAAHVMVESDDRFRGISLSGQKPAVHVGLSYDDPAGWYAGGSLTNVELEPGHHRTAATAYAGSVQRTASRQAWEVGAVYNLYAGTSNDDWGEVFAGFLADRWTARMHFSPDYFGSGTRTLYAELDGTLPITAALHGFAHSGVLARIAGAATAGVDRARYDIRVGLGLRVADLDVRLAWVAVSKAGAYPAAIQQRRTALVLSASHEF